MNLGQIANQCMTAAMSIRIIIWFPLASYLLGLCGSSCVLNHITQKQQQWSIINSTKNTPSIQELTLLL